MGLKYLTHAAVVRCTHGGILQLIPPLHRSLYSGGQPVLTNADLLMGKILGCPQPFKPCISIIEIVAGLADKAIVDGQIPILMDLQALTDGGAVCSALFDAVTKLESDGALPSPIYSPAGIKRNWWQRQWDDFVRMFSDPAFWAGLLVAFVLVLALFLFGVELGILATLGVAVLVGILSAAAAVIVGNLFNHLPWYSGLLEGTIHGALIGFVFAGIAEALPAFLGVAGFIAAMAIIGAGIGIGSNKWQRRPWDQSLLANAGLAGVFAALGKFLPRTEVTEEIEASNLSEGLQDAGFKSEISLKKDPDVQGEGHRKLPSRVQNGKFRRILSGGKVGSFKGRVDFVLTNDGRIVLGHAHSVLSDGKSVAFAGELKFDSNGVLKEITNRSGHYLPESGKGLTAAAKRYLGDRGVDVSSAKTTEY